MSYGLKIVKKYLVLIQVKNPSKPNQDDQNDDSVGCRRNSLNENSDENDSDFVSTISCRDSIKKRKVSFQDEQSRIRRVLSKVFK